MLKELEELIKKAAPIYYQTRSIYSDLPFAIKNKSALFISPSTKTACLILNNPTTNKFFNKYKDKFNYLNKIASSDIEILDTISLPIDDWIFVKKGFDLKSIISPVADVQGWGTSPWGQINSIWGGSRPLINLLAGGALGAGVGYLGGRLGETVLPKKNFEEGKLRRTGLLLGGILGGAPGLYQMLDNWRADNNPLIDKWPPDIYKKALDEGLQIINDSIEEPDLYKKAELDSNFFHSPFINKDEFQQKIWQDNLTPQPIKETTSGIIDASSITRNNSDFVSPFDISRVVANIPTFTNTFSSGILGGAIGKVVGGTLGALAGLKPESQDKLQDIGIWSGILSSLVSRT